MNNIIAGLSIKADYKWISLHYISQVAKDTIIELGMISACILVIYQITKGAPVGGFVMLVSYWYNFTGKSFCRLLNRTSGGIVIKST